MDTALFLRARPPGARRARRLGSHARHHRHLRNGGVLGKQRLRELGIRIALGAQRKEVLRPRWAEPSNSRSRFGRRIAPWNCGDRVLAFIVYQATPRDPLVLGGCVLAMLLLGLTATWIPAQRALSVDPLILLREE